MSDGTSKQNLADKLREVYSELGQHYGYIGVLELAADEIDRLTERLAGAYASVNLLTEMLEAKAPQEASCVHARMAELLRTAQAESHTYKWQQRRREVLIEYDADCRTPVEPNPSEARGVRCPHDGETCGDDKCEDCPNRSAPVEPKPSEARGGYSSGWVIEGAWSAVDRPEYWVGSSSWSTDPYKALRFATRESAQQAADLMCAGVNVRIACHEFAEE